MSQRERIELQQTSQFMYEIGVGRSDPKVVFDKTATSRYALLTDCESNGRPLSHTVLGFKADGALHKFVQPRVELTGWRSCQMNKKTLF